MNIRHLITFGCIKTGRVDKVRLSLTKWSLASELTDQRILSSNFQNDWERLSGFWGNKG